LYGIILARTSGTAADTTFQVSLNPDLTATDGNLGATNKVNLRTGVNAGANWAASWIPGTNNIIYAGQASTLATSYSHAVNTANSYASTATDVAGLLGSPRDIAVQAETDGKLWAYVAGGTGIIHKMELDAA